MSLRLIIFNVLLVMLIDYSTALVKHSYKYKLHAKHRKFNSPIYGSRAAPSGAYPYQVSLQIEKGGNWCVGIIVHPEWIITAAQCILYIDEAKVNDLVAVVGVTNLKQKGATYKVLKKIPHPNYQKEEYVEFDVAILKVNPITFSKTVAKIKVDTEMIGDDVPVTLTGWPSPYFGYFYEVDLQHINFKTSTLEYCNERHSLKIDDTFICTPTTDVGKCHSVYCANTYSGGSLLRRKGKEFVLVGIGIGHCTQKISCNACEPFIYSRVSSYFEWFNEQCNDCLKQ